MDWHAFLTRTVIAPLWARWEGSPYLRHYRRLHRTQFDAPEVIRQRQWSALTAMLHHAHANVPFYRERLDAAGLHPDAIRNFEDFRAVPVLTKTDIRSAGDKLLAPQFHRDRLLRKATSGSTGVPLEIYVDEDSLQHKRACTLRADEWSGWRFGQPVARLWGNPGGGKRGWRARFRQAVLDRACCLDTLKVDEASLERFSQTILRRPPGLILGHAHSVYLFADYVRRQGISGIHPWGIITTAMVLHHWQRRGIEEAFGCPVTNRYGCEEVSLIACECDRHDGLHVNADGVYVEILRDGKPAAPGVPGQVVVTDLTNRAMPLLRYQIGDVAVLTDRRCPCGRGLPLLERLDGREADYVVTPGGDLVSGISLTDHFGCEVPGVAQLQIVQETVSHFVFRFVRGPTFGPSSLNRLRTLVHERFGSGVTYDCDYVDAIPQERSGKYRFCISKVVSSRFNRETAGSGLAEAREPL